MRTPKVIIGSIVQKAMAKSGLDVDFMTFNILHLDF